jgi:hypothetical protein
MLGHMQHVGVMWRTVLLFALMINAGCHARRPDFMTRVRQDCSAGEQWACDLLDALAGPPSMDDAKVPITAKLTVAPPPSGSTRP